MIRLTRDDVRQLLPHGPPMLLLTGPVEIEPGSSGIARRDLVAEDWFFAAHFPRDPVMPGVLIIEAAAQLAALVCSQDLALGAGREGEAPLVRRPGLIAAVERFKFQERIRPGVTLTIKVTVTHVVGTLCRLSVDVCANDLRAATGVIAVSP